MRSREVRAPVQAGWSIGACVRVDPTGSYEPESFVPSFAAGSGGIFIPKIRT